MDRGGRVYWQDYRKTYRTKETARWKRNSQESRKRPVRLLSFYFYVFNDILLFFLLFLNLIVLN